MSAASEKTASVPKSDEYQNVSTDVSTKMQLSINQLTQ